MRYKRESSNNLYKKQRNFLKLFPMTLYVIEIQKKLSYRTHLKYNL